MMTGPKGHESLEAQITFCRWVAWILVIVGAGTAGWGVYHLHDKLEDKFGDLGSYLQGATGSVFALAGLIFIYVAFLGQKQQLIIQSEQFKAQKEQYDAEQMRQRDLERQQQEQLAEQQKQFEAQQASIRRQNFETSFFQLLNNHNQIVAGMRDVDSSKGTTEAEHEVTGRDCLKRWYGDFKQGLWGFEFARTDDGNEMVTKSPKDVVEQYVAFYGYHQGELGHYFRNLYHVIKFVNESEALKDADTAIEYKNRRRYTSLVRATLSQFELGLLFYNCISPFGDRFKPLVEKYGLLKNFDTESLLKPEHEKLIGPDAFK